MITLIIIKNAEIYAPEYLGKKFVVVAGDNIEGVYDDLNIPDGFPGMEVIDAEGKVLFPGFIDSHVHIIGGGGEGGFSTRTPEIQLSQLISAGITTVVGCLGTDGTCRNMRTLLAKAYALEEEGITSYIFTGSYQIPVKSIIGEPDEDIMLIEKVIGVGEVALADHRSSQPTYEEFLRVAAKARVGGLIAGKAGIVNVHIGNGKDGLGYLMRMLRETDIPPQQVLPTHINRSRDLLHMGVEYSKLGGIVDITTSSDPKHLEVNEVKASDALKVLLDNGINIENIQFSSDGQGSLPKFDDNGKYAGLGIGSVGSLYSEVRDAIINNNVPIETALKVITSNVADHFKFINKGRIKGGCHADIILADEESLNITDMFSKGKRMMDNGNIVVKGNFEK